MSANTLEKDSSLKKTTDFGLERENLSQNATDKLDGANVKNPQCDPVSRTSQLTGRQINTEREA